MLRAQRCMWPAASAKRKQQRGPMSTNMLNVLERAACASMSRRQLMRQLALKCVGAREVSAQEAAWYLLGLPFVDCSREVVNLQAAPPHTEPPEFWTSTERANSIGRRTAGIAGMAIDPPS